MVMKGRELFDRWSREEWGGGRFITHRLSRAWGKGRLKLLYQGQRWEPAILSCCTRGAVEGVDARIYSPFSEIKIPALFS